MRAVCILAAAAAAVTAMPACNAEDPTNAIVDNAYPVVPDGGDPSQNMVVYKVWWVATLFPDPVAPGAASTEYRSVPEFGVAIALLAPGWDPASGTPPTTLIPIKSKEVLKVSRGDTLHITISDETFGGNCAVHQQLPQDDADFITERVFPGDFAGLRYDAHTCTSMKVAPPDAGAR
jgi:hypothetical protein